MSDDFIDPEEDLYPPRREPYEHVIEAADRAEPKREATHAMADTLTKARATLGRMWFDQERVDRWRKSVPGKFDVTVELGYVHGEVWFRAWNTQTPTIKLAEATRKPGDLGPLFSLLAQVTGVAWAGPAET
jgi:hypothetical protein